MKEIIMLRTLLGTRLRESRKAKKITQKKLAFLAGISPSYLNLIEHNKRGIAGKTLLLLAKSLDLDPNDLSQGLDQTLIDSVKKAVLSNTQIKIETERSDEFIARFSGFARLIAHLHNKLEQQEHHFTILTDQMRHDPFFSEAMHLMLSNITTIRSTSEILVHSSDISKKQTRKFLENLWTESERMSKTVSEILAHFEPNSTKQISSTDNSPFEVLLEENAYYLGMIENNSISIDTILNELSLEQKYYKKTKKSLMKYQNMAKSLPYDLFIEIAYEQNFDVLKLAKIFKVNFPTLFFRLAHLSFNKTTPRFGLLQCDGSGSVLYRKQLPEFSLPRLGSACPLWPIYRSQSQPFQPISAFLDMPTGERLLTFSISYPTELAELGMPAQFKSLMLFTPDYNILNKPNYNLPQLSVGLQCRVCPRETCESRRNNYLLG